MKDDDLPEEVAIIGGGLAGMATAIHLCDAGLRVLCIESGFAETEAVGESLDWSAPDLLRALGLPMEYLLAKQVATPKRHVVLKLKDGSAQHYVPGAWLGKAPFNINLQTMHVDRSQLNEELRAIFLAKGVRLVSDRVVKVETMGQRVRALVTTRGERIQAKWFIDASGASASLFPRAFRLAAREYGPAKVAIWDYFTVADSIDGTTLHADAAGPGYMEWVWQIPIHARSVSVGYVAPGESIKRQRQQGLQVQAIFQAQLRRFTGLAGLLQEPSGDEMADRVPCIRSFRCRVFKRTAGPNWLLAGEAAAMVDPMTSNGVTAALRQAAEAAGLLIRYRHRDRIPAMAAAMYSRRVLSLARFFNSAIEHVLYEPRIRDRIGAFRAGDLYTIPAWSINVIYARLRPRGLLRTTLFCLLLSSLRRSLSTASWLCEHLQANASNVPGACSLDT